MSLHVGFVDEDIIGILNDPKPKNDPLKLEELRSVIIELNSSRSTVDAVFKEHVKDGTVNELYTAFFTALPPDTSSKLTKMNTEDLSNMLLPMIKVFQIFMTKKANDKVPKVFSSLSSIVKVIFDRIFDKKILAGKFIGEDDLSLEEDMGQDSNLGIDPVLNINNLIQHV